MQQHICLWWVTNPKMWSQITGSAMKNKWEHKRRNRLEWKKSELTLHTIVLCLQNCQNHKGLLKISEAFICRFVGYLHWAEVVVKANRLRQKKRGEPRTQFCGLILYEGYPKLESFMWYWSTLWKDALAFYYQWHCEIKHLLFVWHLFPSLKEHVLVWVFFFSSPRFSLFMKELSKFSWTKLFW